MIHASGRRGRSLAIVLVLFAPPATASAQIYEATGSRALGMGGAFVAVADDSSATWWNPAALPAGPYLLDMALSWTATDSSRDIPARRDSVSGFAIGAPAFGFSYYRLRITEIDAFDPTAPGAPVREDGQIGIPVRSLAVSHLGLSVVQTLLPGVHLGTTLKFLRGTVRTAVAEQGRASDVLDFGDDLGGGDSDREFDFDVGLIATAGAFRGGLVVRNVTEPEFETPDVGAVTLERQVRIGAAFDGAAIGAAPVMVALDADLRAYPATSGDRRVVAIGGEVWLFGRRLGLRTGGRFNTVGVEDRAATAGLTVPLRSGLFVDGHLVRGGSADDRGWGLAARVSF